MWLGGEESSCVPADEVKLFIWIRIDFWIWTNLDFIK